MRLLVSQCVSADPELIILRRCNVKWTLLSKSSSIYYLWYGALWMIHHGFLGRRVEVPSKFLHAFFAVSFKALFLASLSFGIKARWTPDTPGRAGKMSIRVCLAFLALSVSIRCCLAESACRTNFAALVISLLVLHILTASAVQLIRSSCSISSSSSR